MELLRPNQDSSFAGRSAEFHRHRWHDRCTFPCGPEGDSRLGRQRLLHPDRSFRIDDCYYSRLHRSRPTRRLPSTRRSTPVRRGWSAPSRSRRVARSTQSRSTRNEPGQKRGWRWPSVDTVSGVDRSQYMDAGRPVSSWPKGCVVRSLRPHHHVPEQQRHNCGRGRRSGRIHRGQIRQPQPLDTGDIDQASDSAAVRTLYYLEYDGVQRFPRLRFGTERHLYDGHPASNMCQRAASTIVGLQDKFVSARFIWVADNAAGGPYPSLGQGTPIPSVNGVAVPAGSGATRANMYVCVAVP